MRAGARRYGRCAEAEAVCRAHRHLLGVPAHDTRYARRTDAKSDLVNVLSSLEAHWHVLEAEVVEINRDIEYCEQCLRKYGEWFNSPLQYLRVSTHPPRPQRTRARFSPARPRRS